MKLRIYVILAITTIFAANCNFTFEVGMEQEPTQLPTPAEVVETLAAATISAGQTATAAIPTPTYTPVPTPTATPLPGSVVVPATSLGESIPWLPIDRTKWPAIMSVFFNVELPPFNDPLVRQAFAAAVDREEIAEMAEKYYEADPSPATTFIPPQTLGRDLYGEVGINFDPDRAKDLLTQAGYPDTSSFPEVTFIVASYGETAPGARLNMANAMAQMWLEYLGVTINVQPIYSFQAYGSRLKSNPPELFWNGWLPDPGNDPSFIRGIFRSGAEGNYGHFSNSDFDLLVDRAALIHDPAIRQALYIEAERLLCETEAGVIPLYHTTKNIP